MLLLPVAGMAQQADRRVALVVGVGAYRNAPALANPANDARGMAAALARLGVETETVIDPDRSTLEAGVRRFGLRARGADAALFYFAGHGLEVGGRNWLLPATADVRSDRDLRFEALDLDSVLEQIDGAARLALIILDACRDNPFRLRLAGGGRGAGAGAGLAGVRAAVGTLVAFATAPGTIAEDGERQNSPFTAALLRRIETPGLEVRQLLAEVRRDVRQATGGRQVPWEHSALEGSFYFRAAPDLAGSPAGRDASPGRADVPRAEGDLLFWESVRGSANSADLRAYLARFPTGIFAELARNRLAEMGQAAERRSPPVPPPDPQPVRGPPPSAGGAPPPEPSPSPAPEARPAPAQQFAAIRPSPLPPEIAAPPTLAPVPPMPPPEPGREAPLPQLAERAQALADSLACSALTVRASGAGLRLAGLAAPGPELDGLLRRLADIAAVEARIETLDRALCAPLGTLSVLPRPNFGGGGEAQGLLRRDRMRVAAGARAQVQVEAAAGAVLHLDVYGPDGRVQHVHRRAVGGQAGGRRAPVRVAWTTLGAPGPRLVAVVVAPRSLGLENRPEVEDAPAYLAALARALRVAGAEGAPTPTTDLALLDLLPPPSATPPRATQPTPAGTARAGSAHGDRCAAILGRAQVEGGLSDADRAVLRTECRR